MDSITEFLEQCFSVFLFCFAVASLFLLDQQIYRMLDTQKLKMNQNPVLYEQNQTEKPGHITTYEELMALLMQDIKTDMKIDDIEIRPESYDYYTFDFSQIERKSYKETYQYDLDGRIKKVLYKGENK